MCKDGFHVDLLGCVHALEALVGRSDLIPGQRVCEVASQHAPPAPLYNLLLNFLPPKSRLCTRTETSHEELARHRPEHHSWKSRLRPEIFFKVPQQTKAEALTLMLLAAATPKTTTKLRSCTMHRKHRKPSERAVSSSLTAQGLTLQTAARRKQRHTGAPFFWCRPFKSGLKSAHPKP